MFWLVCVTLSVKKSTCVRIVMSLLMGTDLKGFKLKNDNNSKNIKMIMANIY